MFSCRVSGCRFPHTHVTAGHQCGTCGAFGHGQIECGDATRTSELTRRFARERVSAACTVRSCAHRWTHTTEAHRCGQCGTFGGTCEHLTSTIACPTCRVVGPVDPDDTVFGAECVVCMEARPCVVIRKCRHANVCVDCVRHLLIE